MRTDARLTDIGDEHPCFIVFEAGPTHTSLESAKFLAEQAYNAGANAVKFQMLDADRLVANRFSRFKYQRLDRVSGSVVDMSESLYDILRRRELTRDEWVDLRAFVKFLGLNFFCTACFPEEIDFLVELDCHSIKIASADINHFPLIRHAARTGLCIQLDTGGGTLYEVERAVDCVRKEGNNSIIIHHCPTGYPASLDNVNLQIIKTLRQLYPEYPIAFSDHSPDMEMSIAAMMLGANMIEKTITLDKYAYGPEHMFSLAGREIPMLVRTIRNVEKAMGAPNKMMGAAELLSRDKVRRGVYLKEAVVAGTLISEARVEFRRPNSVGFGPDCFDHSVTVGVRFNKDLPEGSVVSFDDLTK